MSVTPTLPIKRAAPDVVRDGIRVAILRGELHQGMQLRQDQLAEQFGTSRIPVREALRQLEAEGLVRIEPNRGAIVTSLSLADVLEMFDIRVALECHALRLAIPEMVEADFAMAEQILQNYDAETNPDRWAEMNGRFHRLLYAPCHRPRLLAMIQANCEYVNRFVRTQISYATGRERPQQEHYQLLAFSRQAKVDEALALLTLHIEHARKTFQASQRYQAQAGNPFLNQG